MSIKCLACDGRLVDVGWEHYWQCGVCGSMQSQKRKSDYRAKYYHRGVGKGWLLNLVNRFGFWDRYKSWGRGSRHNKILEVGYGSGQMLRELKVRGYDVWGVELSETGKKIGRKIAGVERIIELGQVDNKFDLVLSYHVLEHVDNPGDFLRRIGEMMVAGGELIIRVPCYDSWEAKLSQERWYHVDYPYHRVLYTRLGLRKLLESCGFSNVRFNYDVWEYKQVGWYVLTEKLGINQDWIRHLRLGQLLSIPLCWLAGVVGKSTGVIEVKCRRVAVLE